MSLHYSENKITITDVNLHLFIIVPAPSSVTVTSNQSSPIRPFGSNVSLTCTVELTSAVDVLVTVNTVWTGPAGVILYPTHTVMDRFNIHISTATVGSFTRNDSGNYTCMASANSTSVFLSESTSKSSTINLTVGMGIPIVYIT